jgi:prepilin-type N-terminal cleavage/methylation domain-containing protein
MLRIIFTKKGFTLVEVVVAMVITTVSVLVMLSMMPLSWKVARNSDQIGRATGIMQAEIARREDAIMRAIQADGTSAAIPADVANQPVAGEVDNAQFFITTVTCGPNTPPCNPSPTSWTIRVDVNWPNCGSNPCSRNTRVISQQMG